jgi:aspartate/methionine/tyrosine aminotransferase
MLDEIYDLTIYDEIPGSPFRSAVKLFETEQERSKLIWMWGLSKNFALPGMRFAALHTPNEVVKMAVVRFLMHHLPNTTTQFIVREMLDDHGTRWYGGKDGVELEHKLAEWIGKVFLPENG